MRTPQITLSDNVFRVIAELTETLSHPLRGTRATKGVRQGLGAVSYTHLTLPTKRIV